MKLARATVLFAVGALAGTAGRLAAAEVWLKVRTKDVVLYSDASRRDVTEFVVRYSAFRSVFNQMLAPAGRRAPPATIVLFRRVGDFRRTVEDSVRSTDNLVEYSGQIGSNPLIALSGDGDWDRALQSAFEFDTSWMLRRVGYFLPIWMTQGTGQVFASLRLRGGQCEFGDSEELYAGGLEKESLIPWDRFFSVSNTSTEYKGKKDHFTGIYQAQSWAVMNAVLLGGGSLRDRFAALAGKVNGSADDWKAVMAVLGSDDLTHEIWHYQSRTHALKLPFAAAAVRSSLVVGPAPEAEIKTRLSELLGISGQEAEAQQELNRAEALAPSASYVKEARGYAALRHGEQYEAALAFREAIEAGSTDGQAYLVSARQRVADIRGADRPGQGGPDAELAVAEIRRCLQLAPGETGAYPLLARCLFLAPAVSGADLAELEPALADPEDGDYVRFYRALILSRLGRTDECMADLHRVLADPRAGPGPREEALTFLRFTLFTGDRQQVEKLIAAGKFPEARVVVARASQRTDGTAADPADYDRLRVRIADYEVRARAMAFYQEGRWRELRALANDYLKRSPHGGFAQSARTLRRMAREKLKPAASVPPPAEMSSDAPTVSFLINRHWKGFDRYLSHLGDQMLAAWTKAVGPEMRAPTGSTVKVSIYETGDGSVAQIVRFQASPGVPDAVTQACVAAVRAGAPYDKWDDAMAVEMGDRQFLVACFNF